MMHEHRVFFSNYMTARLHKSFQWISTNSEQSDLKAAIICYR